MVSQELKFKARTLYKEASPIHTRPPLSITPPNSNRTTSIYNIYTDSPSPPLLHQLLYLGRNYPDPSYPVKAKLRACFGAHTGGDEEKILAGIKKAEYIKKGSFRSTSDWQCQGMPD